MSIIVSQLQQDSANIGYFVPIDYDEFVDTANSGEMLVGTSVTPSISFISKNYLNTSVNVGYFVPINYDEFVDTANSGEMLVGTSVTPSIQLSKPNPLSNLSFVNIPTVTYVVTDGSPIILVSVFNTQYWSTS